MCHIDWWSATLSRPTLLLETGLFAMNNDDDTGDDDDDTGDNDAKLAFVP